MQRLKAKPPFSRNPRRGYDCLQASSGFLFLSQMNPHLCFAQRMLIGPVTPQQAERELSSSRWICENSDFSTAVQG